MLQIMAQIHTLDFMFFGFMLLLSEIFLYAE